MLWLAASWRAAQHPRTLLAIVERRTARLAEALSAAGSRLQAAGRNRQENAEQRLAWRRGRISVEAYQRRLDLAAERLSAKLALVDSLRPERLLSRGYSITRTAAGEIVRSVQDVRPGTVLLTSLADGTVTSNVTSNVTKTEERSDG